MKHARPRGWWAPALLLAVATGCTQSTDTIDPQVLAAHRERLVLADEPDGAMGVVDLREIVAEPDEAASAGDTPPESSEAAEGNGESPSSEQAVRPERMVVVGRIGGVPNPWKQSKPDYPWSRNLAEFVISDAAAAAEIEGHSHAHDDPDHECPFCSSAAGSDVVAVVRFTDEAGKVIPIDARELFGLQGGETVVIRGTPHVRGDAKDGLLLVDADGLYVRR